MATNYYVSATHSAAGLAPGKTPTGGTPPLPDRVRTDLGKFPSKAAADAFAASLHNSWLLVQVDARSE